MMAIFFGCLFSMGLIFFWLFSHDMIRDRITRYTTWKELTGKQWLYLLGSLLMPIGFVGLLFIKHAA